MNPFESPLTPAETQRDHVHGQLRLAIFLINFGVSTSMAILSVIAVCAPTDPRDPIAGVILLIPSAIYAVSEWRAYYRDQRVIERRLGWVNLAFCAFVTFGIITNVGEVLMENRRIDFVFLAAFVAIGASIAAYLGLTGIARLRWTKGGPTRAGH